MSASPWISTFVLVFELKHGRASPGRRRQLQSPPLQLASVTAPRQKQKERIEVQEEERGSGNYRDNVGGG
eukprot:SAG22_NODE_4515_length_1246_cov_2.011334_2_plen_70_part_00